MDCRAANFDSNHRVEHPHRRLERLEVEVVVGEEAEVPRVHAEAYACMDVLLRGLEPCIALGLRKVSEVLG